jgi:hypothetical protein
LSLLDGVPHTCTVPEVATGHPLVCSWAPDLPGGLLKLRLLKKGVALCGASWQACVSSGGAVQEGSRAPVFPDLYEFGHQHQRLSYLAVKQMVASASNQSNLCVL